VNKETDNVANHPVADRVKHLSVRIDDDDMLRIDKIRDKLGKSSGGITPHRSQVLRRVISLGIETYSSQLAVDTAVVAPTKKPEAKKAEPTPKNGKKARAAS